MLSGFFIVHGLVEARLNTVAAYSAKLIDHDDAHLEFFPIGGFRNDTPRRQATRILRRVAPPYQFHGQDAADGTEHCFADSGRAGGADFVIHIAPASTGRKATVGEVLERSRLIGPESTDNDWKPRTLAGVLYRCFSSAKSNARKVFRDESVAIADIATR